MRWLVAAVVVIGACSKDGGDPPLKPGPPPPHVAAVISLPSTHDTFNRVGAFFDAMSPGMGASTAPALLAELSGLAGVDKLDGFDRHEPMHLVVLAPPGGDATEVVLIAAVGERGRLDRSVRGAAAMRVSGGWAAIGGRAAVEATAPWALHELVSRPPPAQPTALLHPGVLRAAYPAALTGRGNVFNDADVLGMIAYQVGPFADAALAAFVQSERVEVSLDISATGLIAEATLTPRAQTALASFAAAQRPSTFTMFGRLERFGGGGYAGGNLMFGALGAPVGAGMRWWFGRLLRRPATVDELAVMHGVHDGAELALSADAAGGVTLVSEPSAGADAAQMRALPPALARHVDDAQARGDSFLIFGQIGGVDAEPPRDGMWLTIGAPRPGTLRVRAGTSVAQLAAFDALAEAESDPGPEPDLAEDPEEP